MPDDQDPPAPKPAPDDDADRTDADPDAGAKSALAKERAARRQAEKDLADLRTRLKDVEDKDKSEVERLREQVAGLTKDRDEHARTALRLEVAAAKGLTPSQAKRLVGSTVEELEADAEELVAAFAPKGGNEDKSTPGGRPKERLRGGGDPTEEPEETDPRKLAALIPRV